MTRLRCSSENDVASPVVPSTFNPSQPLASRKRASAVERAQSGSPLSSTAVAMAAITPCSLLVVIWLLQDPEWRPTEKLAPPSVLSSSADIERRERRHIDELGVIGRERHDLHRPVKPNQDRPDDRGAAQFLQQLGRDR